MKILRGVVTLLLCVALPIQGYAALRLVVRPCPAMHGTQTAMHGSHQPVKPDGCPPMPCCPDQQNGPLPGNDCKSCASCVLSPAFAALEASPALSLNAQDLGVQRRTPALNTLDLSAIWRPPTTG